MLVGAAMLDLYYSIAGSPEGEDAPNWDARARSSTRCNSSVS